MIRLAGNMGWGTRQPANLPGFLRGVESTQWAEFPPSLLLGRRNQLSGRAGVRAISRDFEMSPRSPKGAFRR